MLQYKDKARQKQWESRQQQRAAAAEQQQQQQGQMLDKHEPAWERKLPSAKRRQLEAKQDESDFAAEHRLLRKLKRGKISEVCPLW